MCHYDADQWEALSRLRISVIIPCYNEVLTIRQVVSAVQGSPVKVHEIIVIDDGSNDGTREVLQSEIAGGEVRVIYHEKNMGKGAAVRSGLMAFSGDVVIVQDADLEYDPQQYWRLLAPIVHGQADVVFGSRFMGSDPHRVLYFWHSLGNKLLTLLSNMLSDLNLTDMEAGYKVAKREIADQISFEENRFGFEPEFTAKVAKLDCRIYEVGISYSGRTYREGKKIGWWDGIIAVWCIFKYNLFRRKPCETGEVRRKAWRTYLGIGLVACALLGSNFQMLVNCDLLAAARGVRGRDEISCFLKCFDGIRETLPERAAVGFFSDVALEGSAEFGKTFFLTQYALAPILVANGLEHELAVGVVRSPSESSLLKEKGLSVVRRFGDRVVLLRKVSK